MDKVWNNSILSFFFKTKVVDKIWNIDKVFKVSITFKLIKYGTLINDKVFHTFFFY